jgi:flagellin
LFLLIKKLARQLLMMVSGKQRSIPMTVINSNISALRAQSSMTNNARSLSTAMERLSTGVRINSAADDAAGLAISTRMTSDIRGLSVAIRNANDGISLAQTAEGAIGEVTNILQRMRELAVQSSNGTLTSDNRAAMQVEFTQLTAQIDNIASTTNFNGIKLLDGTNKTVSLQTGVRQGDTVDIAMQKTDSKGLGLQGAATVGQLNSGRVSSPASLGTSDIKINGYDWTAAGTTYTGTKDFASEIASAINLNTGAHRVQAAASNSVTSVAPNATSFAKGDLNINGNDIGAAGNLTELVANINRDAAGVNAVLNANQTITLSNNTGNTIDMSASLHADLAGFKPNVFEGFVALNNLDAAPIAVVSNNQNNGFAANMGNAASVETIGFNETSSNGPITSKAVAGDPATDKITLDDDVRINGVRLGVSADASALAKSDAINAISQKTGVTAKATTVVKLALDLSAPNVTGTTTLPVTFNGKTIDFATAGPGAGAVKNVENVVSAINAAGINGMSASAGSDGKLVLTATTGADIIIGEANTQPLVAGVSDGEGNAITAASNTFTAHGRLTLQSQTGGIIRLEDLSATPTVLRNKLGLAAQNIDFKGGGSLSIGDQNNAGISITAIDKALNTVNLQRANLGAMQNRLEAAVNSLTSASTNMSAARSRILDTDYGLETTALSKAQVIQQAASAMLAQANQQPQQILSLLKQ